MCKEKPTREEEERRLEYWESQKQHVLADGRRLGLEIPDDTAEPCLRWESCWKFKAAVK